MKQATIPFVLAILVATSEPSAGVGFAQFGCRTHLSIEWLTASSDVVVRASVADLAYKDRAPQAGEMQAQWQWVTVTLKVRETLKGKAPEKIVYVIEQPRGADTLPKWKKSGQSVLWFLEDRGDKKEELPRDFPDQPRGKLRPSHHVELGTPKTGKRVPHPVFSMDFRVLDEEDKILEAIKTDVSLRDPSKKRASRAICISISGEVAARSGRAGDTNELCVPVNGRLQQLARTWASSKESWIRLAGVQALGPFQSEANAAILKGMLADKASWVEHKEDRDPGERVYYIRESAWKTLRKWKVSAPKPVLRIPLKED